MSVQFITPVGRIVWGHPGRSSVKKDMRTKQPIMRDGKQVEQWNFGLAIPKAEFQNQVMPYLNQEAATLFPSGVPQTFSWKYKDGDSVDRNGKPYSNREGYGGHYVLTIATEVFAPPIWKFENGAYRAITAEELKTGDYVAVNLTVKANKPQDTTMTPGLYVNPNGIIHVGYGQEIMNGADPDDLFAGANFALPPGASSTPLVPTAPMPGMQNNFVNPVTTQNIPPSYINQTAPVNLPPPAHDFVQNAGQQNYVQQPGQVQYQQAQTMPGQIPNQVQPGFVQSQQPVQVQHQPQMMPGMPVGR